MSNTIVRGVSHRDSSMYPLEKWSFLFFCIQFCPCNFAPCILLKIDLFFSSAFNFALFRCMYPLENWSFLFYSILKIDLFSFFPFDFALFRCASQWVGKVGQLVIVSDFGDSYRIYRACWNSSKHSIMSKTWFNSAFNAKLNKNCFWLRKTQPWQRWNTFIGRSQF